MQPVREWSPQKFECGEDDALYSVKFFNNGPGNGRALVAEHLAGRCGALIGAPVAEVALIRVAKAFFEDGLITLHDSHAGAVNVGLTATCAHERAVPVGSDVEMVLVVLACHGPADRALPAIGRTTAFRAQEPLARHRHLPPIPSRQFLRWVVMPRRESRAPATKISTAR